MEEEGARIDINPSSSLLIQDEPEIRPVSISPQQTPPPDPPSDSRERERSLNERIPLYRAAMKGDWKTAEGIFGKSPTTVRLTITPRGDTALHIAAAAKHVHFVEEMVNIMEPEDLELQNRDSNTAFCFAAVSGIRGIADAMMKKNKNLPTIPGRDGMMPLQMAARLGHGEMVWYLYNNTAPEKVTDTQWVEILNTCIGTDLYDVALDISRCYPKLAVERDKNDETALHYLSRKPCAFSGGDQLHMWNTFINSISCKRVEQKEKMRQNKALLLVEHLWQQVIVQSHDQILDLISRPSPLIHAAAELGNSVFLTQLIASYPDLMWELDSQKGSIFHTAVLHRHESIFNLIYEIGSLKNLIVSFEDDNHNNILHLAAMLPPRSEHNIVSGAALQMQRELLWFKEVEKIMPPSLREKKNNNGETPSDLFTKEHKDLMKEGEKWMRDTAAQSMLVATLIATVVFAAAFTVPGDSNQDTGIPILLRKKSFMIFAISDAIALFCSSTSTLVFLSILTSRYAEECFLKSLPSRLMSGLITLFVSIISMMVTFTTTFFLVFGHRFAWAPILTAVFACVPVILYFSLQYPLLADIFRSTYGSRFLFPPSKHMLY